MDEKEYEALVDMFVTDGWKAFIKSAGELERAITEGVVDSADTNDKWQYCRGQLHQLRSILGYEAFVRTAWDNHLKQQQEEASEEGPDVDSI